MINGMYDPLRDGKSQLQLVDYMGGELHIVNDARASFNKQKTELDDGDIKLLRYLIKHKHFSPLRSTVFKFRVKAPLSICRQWWKHCLASNHNDEQLGWNEQSLRYVTVQSDEFYFPAQYRAQSTNNKQCSAGVLNDDVAYEARIIYENHCHNSFFNYTRLIELGVARELARNVLPPAQYTCFLWTVSLQAVLNFIDLRCGKGAQDEITMYADVVKSIVLSKVPNVVEAWEEFHS